MKARLKGDVHIRLVKEGKNSNQTKSFNMFIRIRNCRRGFPVLIKY